jgi:membrane protease YdiL (CAAX protease family)
MTSEHSTSERGEPPRTLTVLQVLAFYLIVLLSAWLVSSLLSLENLSPLYNPIVNTGLYGLLLIPIAYKFDSRIFSKAYWAFPSRAWVGIGLIAVAQLLINFRVPRVPINHHRAIEAVLIAPFVEEVLRAVTICPLMQRLGGPAGLLVTALMWTWPHDFFWIALVQQTILSLIFVYTRKSLPATIAAHTVMNVIAVSQVGLRTLIPH